MGDEADDNVRPVRNPNLCRLLRTPPPREIVSPIRDGSHTEHQPQRSTQRMSREHDRRSRRRNEERERSRSILVNRGDKESHGDDRNEYLDQTIRSKSRSIVSSHRDKERHTDRPVTQPVERCSKMRSGRRCRRDSECRCNRYSRSRSKRDTLSRSSSDERIHSPRRHRDRLGKNYCKGKEEQRRRASRQPAHPVIWKTVSSLMFYYNLF